jgi:hypothetical protein
LPGLLLFVVAEDVSKELSLEGDAAAARKLELKTAAAGRDERIGLEAMERRDCRNGSIASITLSGCAEEECQRRRRITIGIRSGRRTPIGGRLMMDVRLEHGGEDE